MGASSLGREVAQAPGEQPWLGPHVVGFLDDDADKQGQYIAGASTDSSTSS